MSFIKQEEKDIKEIWRRIKKRDFSGNSGTAIKNSIYQLSTNIVAKIGALIFTIVLARLLMPELFGLYNLALSTILIFVSISELGIVSTLIRFVSRELGKKNDKIAKSYLIYLGKLKFLLILVSIIILLFSAKFISDTYYQKPLFLALLAGILYIIFVGISGILQATLQASNYFKGVFQGELIFQTSRVILVPLVVLITLKLFYSEKQILFYIILALAVSYFFTVLFMGLFSMKKIQFLKTKKTKLTKKRVKEVDRFLWVTAVFVFSGVFFSYVDKIMLGRFVGAEFIGYYAAAFGLIGALSSLIGFGTALFPVFSRIKGEKLKKGLTKTLGVVFVLSIFLFFGTLLFAPLIISIVYGSEYFLGTNILRLLSLLLIFLPLTGIYTSYFMSKGKPQTVAKLLVVSTIVNVFLNYILITLLLRFGNLAAVYGAGIATLISQGVYLAGLMLMSKNNQ